jgi:hypothetical protein
MGSKRSLRPRRWEEIRARWRAHLEAQRMSGRTQVAYCQAHGLDPRYFSVWKGKLKPAERTARRAPAPKVAKHSVVPLVPVVIKSSSGTDASTTDPLTIHLRLPNGLSVSITIPSLNRLPSVLEHLAQTPC